MASPRPTFSTSLPELRETCRQRSVELIGGHTEIVPGLERPILVGMMLGDASPSDLVTPGQARPGDVLLVTKGLAIEGTALLARERADELKARIGEAAVQAAANLLHDPGISIVKEAEIARRSGGITALHDPTEGGFATAVRELAMLSGTGVEIDGTSVPVLPETIAVADALDLDPLGMLASGSLLIASRPEAVTTIVRDIEAARIPVKIVGTLTDTPSSFTLIYDGTRRDLTEFAVDEVARLLSFSSEPRPGSSSAGS
jgi:hydrogenase maturation factor